MTDFTMLVSKRPASFLGTVRAATQNLFPRSAEHPAEPSTIKRIDAGFSLLEVVGVMAVMALLAAALIPPMIKRIDRAAWERETRDLNTLAQGLVQSIKITRHIPPTNGIAATIANYSNLAPNQVTTNARGFGRVMLVDPNVAISGYNPASSVDFTNSNTGPTTAPANARVMFLSTLARPPLTNAALTSISSSNFNQIWNNSEGNVPPVLGNRGADDLKIQRLELGGLFYKMVLLNIDTNAGSLAWYTLDRNAPSSVALGNQITVYVLDGTALSLYAGGTNNLQLREIFHEDQSFIYQNGRWSRDLSSAQVNTGLGPFGQIVDRFLQVGLPPDPEFGATPQAVVESFYNYIVGYILWATGDPPQSVPAWQGGGQTACPQYPYYKLLWDSQNTLKETTVNLIK